MFKNKVGLESLEVTMLQYACILAFLLCLKACTTPAPISRHASCSELETSIDWSQQIETLNRLSLLFEKQCYESTVRVGQKVRDIFQHKQYSIMKESAELFLAEGTVTDYVLESYERGYLSFLLTLSQLRQGQRQALTPALNRFYNEDGAQTYNHGQDPINTLLQALLWENFSSEGYSARPFWLWLSQSDHVSPDLKIFAQQRLLAMDSHGALGGWHVYRVGRFPQLDWNLTFSDPSHGYITVKPIPPFPDSCRGEEELLVPVKSWFQKIAIRHSHDYHPLVHAKSWIRLPIGIAYGISTFAAGASLLVGGCALDAGTKGDGTLCQVSLQGGVALMAQSDEVIDYALRPDLRHWEQLPQAIYLTRKSRLQESSTCLEKAQQLGAELMF